MKAFSFRAAHDFYRVRELRTDEDYYEITVVDLLLRPSEEGKLWWATEEEAKAGRLKFIREQRGDLHNQEIDLMKLQRIFS